MLRTRLAVRPSDVVIALVTIALSIEIATPSHHVSIVCRLVAIVERHGMDRLAVQILRRLVAVKVRQSLDFGDDYAVEAPISILHLLMRANLIAPLDVRVAEVGVLGGLTVIDAIMAGARAGHANPIRAR